MILIAFAGAFVAGLICSPIIVHFLARLVHWLVGPDIGGPSGWSSTNRRK